MGMGGHLGFVEGGGLRLKLEGSWSLALTLFYLGVGGIQILALILQGLHPPHLGVLALLSLTAAYGIIRRRWWVVHLVVALFLLGTTFGAATLYSSIRLQTFYPDLPGLLFHLGLIIYLLLNTLALIYTLRYRRAFQQQPQQE